jgi:hypothetical protein
MVYEHVARALPGGFFGIDESLPDEVVAGQNYTWDFIVTIEPDWDIEYLQIVGLVADKETEFILNAIKSDDIMIAAPQISIDPMTITFDTTYVNYLSVQTIMVNNIGEIALEVLSINSTNSAFTANYSSLTIEPGESESLEITFTPQTEQLYEGLLQFESNDITSGVINVEISGYGAIQTGIELIEPSNEFDIYPNPSSDILNISSNEVIKSITLINSNGLEFGSYKFNSQHIRLNTAAFKCGLYLIRIETEYKTQLSRIIIK